MRRVRQKKATAAPKGAHEEPIRDGIRVVHLDNWNCFDDYITQRMLDRRQFIWRGHASDRWLLESTLDRLLRNLGKLKHKTVRNEHLERYRYSTRGRRGVNPPKLETENEWWALGQHFGLATPLLDFTASPYVAAYFAFYPEESDGADRRAVFGVSRISVRVGNETILEDWKGTGRAPIVELVEPLSDENPRLVSQGGLFTRSPDGVDLESWFRQQFAGDTSTMRLVKITIPSADRELALRNLNRMNINHLSLFPDLYGASRFTNLDLLIKKY